MNQSSGAIRIKCINQDKLPQGTGTRFYQIKRFGLGRVIWVS
jgi:hypothetical protein